MKTKKIYNVRRTKPWTTIFLICTRMLRSIFLQHVSHRIHVARIPSSHYYAPRVSPIPREYEVVAYAHKYKSFFFFETYTNENLKPS